MVRSILQLEPLREAWDALSAPLESPLLDHDWFLSCAEAFHAAEDLRVLTVWSQGMLIGAAPLVREGGRLVLLGSTRLFEPVDWLAASSGALQELAEQAIGLGEPMVLQRIPAGSGVIDVLLRQPRRRALSRVTVSGETLAVNTRGDWAAYHAGLSSRITSNLPRLRRRAERDLGPMRVVHSAPRPSEVTTHLEQVMAVEGSGWKARRGSSLSARADLRDFFERYGRRAAERGRLRVTTLWFGAHVAAVELGVEAYRRMWQLKIGFQDALRQYYPGLHLTEWSIRSAFERGLMSYEFLGSAAAWEQQWQPESRSFRLVAVYPVTARGLLRACRDAVSMVGRRLTPKPPEAAA